MFDYYLAITDRHLCRGDFLEQIEKITSYSLQAVILRESDLSDESYEQLAKQVLDICRVNDATCILYDRVEIARKLNCQLIHMSMEGLRKWSGKLEDFHSVGASCFRLEEVLEAKALGAQYVVLGNVFPDNYILTPPPQGIGFLREVCAKTDMPVFAVGGAKPARMPEILDAGAVGGCMVSGFMLL